MSQRRRGIAIALALGACVGILVLASLPSHESPRSTPSRHARGILEDNLWSPLRAELPLLGVRPGESWRTAFIYFRAPGAVVYVRDNGAVETIRRVPRAERVVPLQRNRIANDLGLRAALDWMRPDDRRGSTYMLVVGSAARKGLAAEVGAALILRDIDGDGVPDVRGGSTLILDDSPHPVHGSLWRCVVSGDGDWFVLDSRTLRIRRLLDADGDQVPDTLQPEPFLTARQTHALEDTASLWWHEVSRSLVLVAWDDRGFSIPGARELVVRDASGDGVADRFCYRHHRPRGPPERVGGGPQLLEAIDVRDTDVGVWGTPGATVEVVAFDWSEEHARRIPRVIGRATLHPSQEVVAVPIDEPLTAGQQVSARWEGDGSYSIPFLVDGPGPRACRLLPERIEARGPHVLVLEGRRLTEPLWLQLTPPAGSAQEGPVRFELEGGSDRRTATVPDLTASPGAWHVAVMGADGLVGERTLDVGPPAGGNRAAGQVGR